MDRNENLGAPEGGAPHHDEHPHAGAEVGEAVGGVSGVVAGAAVGSAVGPIGTIIGGIAGAVGGWWAGRAVSEATHKFTSEDDTYYRERFESRRTHARRFGRGIKLLNPLCIGRVGGELPAFCLLHQLKRSCLFDIFDFQLLERSCDFRFLCSRKLVRQKFVCATDAFHGGEKLSHRQGFLRAKEKRFDYLRQRHIRNAAHSLMAFN